MENSVATTRNAASCYDKISYKSSIAADRTVSVFLSSTYKCNFLGADNKQ